MLSAFFLQELYNELDVNKPVIEGLLKRGGEYLELSPESSSVSLDHNLKTLKHRWDAAQNKANDRKVRRRILLLGKRRGEGSVLKTATQNNDFGFSGKHTFSEKS